MENNNIENNIPETEEPIIPEASAEQTVPEQAEIPLKSEGFDFKETTDAVIEKGKVLGDSLVEKGKELGNKVKPALDKGISLFKQDPKKYGIIAGGALVALIAVIIVISVLVSSITNSYKTPIKTMEKYDNAKKYYSDGAKTVDLLNGFCEKEMKNIYKLYQSTEDYKENIDDLKEDFKDNIEDIKDEYGNNYKYKYKIIDKDKIDRDDLKDFRDELRDFADTLEYTIDETDDFDSDDWEDFADDLGFDGSKSKAKKLIKNLEKIRKNYKSAKVSDGYEVEVEIILKGSELDEPIEKDATFYVYKVDGRWVTSSIASLNFG